MASPRMSSAIQRIATRWAGMLTTLAKEFAPIHTKEYIHSRTARRGDYAFTITVGVNLGQNPAQKNGSADAAAQEYGSGLRSDQDINIGYIDIYPKTRKYLAFHWDIADANPERFRFLPDGRVLLSHVMSPGIHPYKGLGYLRPAITELIAQANDDLKPDIVNAVVGDVVEMFKSAK